jgi:hypothetical protein
MKIIYSVKFYGKTNYGTLTFDVILSIKQEFKTLIIKDDMWDNRIELYFNKSFIMNGDY